jgi:hypothetical protein
LASSLAYVFWHWPRGGVSPEAYEEKLASFQRTLSSSRVPGLLEALSFRVGSLPWVPADGPAYEDWYVVKDFSALDALNEGAVRGNARNPHDLIAKDYLKGAGGVLRLISGSVSLRDARSATWIEKPIGPSYQSYYDDVAGVVGEKESSLWRRQLVLGPSPQFCVHSEDAIEFPQRFRPVVSTLKLIQ